MMQGDTCVDGGMHANLRAESQVKHSPSGSV